MFFGDYAFVRDLIWHCVKIRGGKRRKEGKKCGNGLFIELTANKFVGVRKPAQGSHRWLTLVHTRFFLWAVSKRYAIKLLHHIVRCTKETMDWITVTWYFETILYIFAVPSLFHADPVNFASTIFRPFALSGFDLCLEKQYYACCFTTAIQQEPPIDRWSFSYP